MHSANSVFAHSGGVTSVLNTTAASLIYFHRNMQMPGTLFAAENGIQGLLKGNLLDTSTLSHACIETLSHTPGSLFGSCRYKLPIFAEDKARFHALFSIFKRHNITTLFYQGGNDSQDTLQKIQHAANHMHQPLQCIGLPKTIDNDLYGTDFAPGFPSAAKYLLTSIYEASYDLASMASGKGSTQVFVMEVMGRNTGWLAAATGLAAKSWPNAPHLILIPEHPIALEVILDKVQHCVQRHGYCSMVISEGFTFPSGQKITQSLTTDAFSHPQLGGAGQVVSNAVKHTLGLKTHYANPDYLQRSASHYRAPLDVKMSWKLGKWAMESCKNGESGIMLGLKAPSNQSADWSMQPVALERCALHEKILPSNFYDPHTFSITQEAINALTPLISGPPAMPKHTALLPNYLSKETLTKLQHSYPKIMETT